MAPISRRSLLAGFPTLLRAEGKLDEAFAVAQASSKHGGLVVMRRGQSLFEKYYGLGSREAAPNLASCGKTITSIAAGILVGERPYLFPAGLDQKIYTVRHLPKEAFPWNDSRKAAIKLGHLLTMTSGIGGNSPGFILGKPVDVSPAGPDGWQASVDETAVSTGMWCSPGSGFSYSTAGVHVISMMIRRITGLELDAYVAERLAAPLGWDGWSWGYNRPEVAHTPGGGGIQLRAPDVIRFGEMLLGEGRWNGAQIAPVEYVKACGRLSPYNPHAPYGLQFEVNGDSHLDGVPRDAFWKSGSGGHCLYVVPSLELVLWKLGGRDDQYSAGSEPASTWTPGLPESSAAIKVLQLAVSAIS